jgi:peroxiredoxin
MRAPTLLAALAVVSLLSLAAAAAPLRVGDKAPDFSLVDQHGKDVRLSDFRGQSNVVVAFYVMAFTPG